MKIVYVLNQFLPWQTAGTEIYVWALASRMQKSGISVEILIPNFGSSQNREYLYDNLKVVMFAENTLMDKSLVLGNKVPQGLHHFKLYLSQSNPDIVHFHELSGSNGITIQHVKVAKEMGFKTLLTFHLAGYTCKTASMIYLDKYPCDGIIDQNKCGVCHLNSMGIRLLAQPLMLFSWMFDTVGIDTLSWKNKLGTALGTRSVIRRLKNNFCTLQNNLDQFIAITDWYEQVLIKNGVAKNKITKIRQGLVTNPSLSHLVSDKNDEKKSTPLKLMYLGRIAPQKGLDQLVDAISDIDVNKYTLHIYGDSGDPKYEKRIRKMTQNMPNVKWMGKLENAEVYDTMRRHDMLCLCSTFSEMSPLVIQEAFAAGLPVLASHVTGNAEQIQHGKNGWLYAFKDIKALKAQLLEIINNHDIIDAVKSNIIKPRSFDLVVDEYTLLYNNLIAK